jgi:ferric-dicitrate binding protein FerR (iron transport regulator)
LIRDALAWVVQLKSGEATFEDAEQLINWRGQSPAHERAFRDAVKCWQAVGRGLVSDEPARRGRRRRTKSPSLS